MYEHAVITTWAGIDVAGVREEIKEKERLAADGREVTHEQLGPVGYQARLRALVRSHSLARYLPDPA